MLIKVKLLGELGRKFGRSYSFDASSPRQVISALSNQLEGFREYMLTAHERGISFRLVSDNPEGMDYPELAMACKQLVIAPIVSGAGATGRILFGVALIAVGIFSAGAGFAGLGFANLAGNLGGALAATAGNIGIALVLTGVAQLLTPSPKTPGDIEKQDSFLFDNASETSSQGLPVPLLYGKFLATSPLIISSSISTVQVPT
jgi:predicted phage tail protein